TRERILDCLKDRLDQFVSGEEMGRRLGISRTAVWKHIQALREAGYEIEAQSRSGYRLRRIPDRLYPEEVKKNLKTSWLGHVLIYLEETSSTNWIARELAEKGCSSGAVVVAESQTQGRGRRGRFWHSPSGKGLWFSVVLRPQVEPFQAPQLTLLTGVAVAQAVKRFTGLPVGLKWPNDLWVGGKKLGGILTEIKAEMDAVEYVVVGIGLNVNLENSDFPEELRGTATSLLLSLHKKIPRVALLQEILGSLEKIYELWQEEGFDPVRRAWKEASCILDREVEIRSGDGVYRGIALDIDGEGALLVRTGEGEIRRFLSGEVSLRVRD
ncbi:MAG TPA: biotin--[acetyl-CoA-carboxylase] ligase, partial [Moorella mulderi]|nr:biotin--[acetyl-CoA-carboxylase] ligase [Moorella mulderi]